MKNRKSPSTSTAAAIKAMMNATKPPLQVPAHMKLEPHEVPYWDGILRARTRDEWTEVDLVLAVQLARCQSDIELQSAELKSEGSVVLNARGTPVANPRAAILQQLAMRQLALMRSLRMTGVALSGDKRDLEKMRAIERDASKAKSAIAEEEDLLAL